MSKHSYEWGLSGRVEYELDDATGTLLNVDGVTVAPEHPDMPNPGARACATDPVGALNHSDTAAMPSLLHEPPKPDVSSGSGSLGEAGRGVPVSRPAPSDADPRLTCPWCYSTRPAADGRCHSCGYCEGCS